MTTLLNDSVFGAIPQVLAQVKAYRFQQLQPPKTYAGWRSMNQGGLTSLFGSRAELNVPKIKLPSFGKEGIRGIEGDPLYGMMDQQELELLLGLVAAQKPQRVLVLGSGRGILPLVIHQVLFDGFDPGKTRVPVVVAVELGEETPSFALSQRQQTYRKGEPHDFLLQGLERGVIARWSDKALGPDCPLWLNQDPIGLEMVHADSFSYLLEQAGNQSSQFDLVVVDASHDRDAALGDILGSWEVLTEEGVIFVDDFGKTTNTGVTTAVHLTAWRTGIHPFSVCELDTGFAPKCALLFKKLRPLISRRREVEIMLMSELANLRIPDRLGYLTLLLLFMVHGSYIPWSLFLLFV